MIGGAAAAATTGAAGASISKPEASAPQASAAAAPLIHPNVRRTFILLDPSAFPGICRMTAVALRAVFAEVPVILMVAAPAK